MLLYIDNDGWLIFKDGLLEYIRRCFENFGGTTALTKSEEMFLVQLNLA